MADPTPYRALNIPEAVELAEAALVRHDLRSSFLALKLWAEKFHPIQNTSPEEKTIGLSLFRDAIVTFVACFDANHRFQIPINEVYRKVDGGLEFFKWLEDMRSAYEAHRFGKLRQAAIGVLLDHNTNDIVHMRPLSSIYYGPPPDEAQQILSFMSLAGQWLDSKIKDLQQKCNDGAQALTSEQLCALGPVRFHGVDPSDVRKQRPGPKKQKSRM